MCVCARVWHYDLLSVFMCLSVPYIDDEWKKQENIIRYSDVIVWMDPSCSAEELSQFCTVGLLETGVLYSCCEGFQHYTGRYVYGQLSWLRYQSQYPEMEPSLGKSELVYLCLQTGGCQCLKTECL